VCPMQTLLRGLSGHQKRHCSGAFRSHDMIYGLSEALWTLAISLECLIVAILCIESRSLVGTLILDIRRKTRQGVCGLLTVSRQKPQAQHQPNPKAHLGAPHSLDIRLT
jgi:hypothetical protein